MRESRDPMFVAVVGREIGMWTVMEVLGRGETVLCRDLPVAALIGWKSLYFVM